MRPLLLPALLILLSATARAADDARPPARGSSPLACPITSSQVEAGEPAGVRYFHSLPEDLRKQVEKDGQAVMGEQKKDGGTYGGYVRAVAIFRQSKQRVFELMRDTAAQALYLPHIQSATVVARPENGELTQFILKFIWKQVQFRVRHWFYPETSRSEWALDTSAPHDIRGQEGYWQLFEMGPDLTIGEYGTRVDTGLAVPQFIQDMFARADIPKALTAFRKYMDSGGTYRRQD
jgi:hypothetical protein